MVARCAVLLPGGRRLSSFWRGIRCPAAAPISPKIRARLVRKRFARDGMFWRRNGQRVLSLARDQRRSSPCPRRAAVIADADVLRDDRARGPLSSPASSPRTVDIAPIAPTVEGVVGDNSRAARLFGGEQRVANCRVRGPGGGSACSCEPAWHERHPEMMIRVAGPALGGCRSNSDEASVCVSRVHQSWWAAKNAQSSVVASAALLGWSCGRS
jgi:hypothetical protein